MRSLLIVSADVDATEQVQRIAEECHFRCRTLASPDAARDWLSMQDFDVMLIDSGFKATLISDLLSLAWTYHPLLMGGVFNLEEIDPEEWAIAMLGAQVFSGSRALDKIRDYLKKLPDSSALVTSKFAVLVIEDLDAPRDIICAFVQALGYSRVDGVGSAVEALKLLHDDPYVYFSVITDIRMPEVDGIDLIESIRNDPDPFIRALPVIVLTAVPTPENLIACVKAGASGFLVKPPKKKLIKKELDKAMRIAISKQSPRLCPAHDTDLLKKAIEKLGLT